MIQHEATIYLYSISSTALIKLSATNRTHLSTKQVVSEPKVEKFGISLGSHGGGGARERLQKVARVVCGWSVALGAWQNVFREIT